MTHESGAALSRFQNCIRFSLWLWAIVALPCYSVSAASDTEKHYYAIPEGKAWKTLKDAAKESGVDLVYSRSGVVGVRTNPLHGEFTVQDAFERLLEGTPLAVVRDDQTEAYTVYRRSVEASLADKDENIPDNEMPRKLVEQKTIFDQLKRAATAISVIAISANATAQDDATQEEEVFELSPFTVDGDADQGYRATHTLAGTRLRTDLKDVGSAISVVTKEFLDDTASTNNESLLVYTLGTEVGGPAGNFGASGAGPILNETFENASSKTRVRGLTSADNTIDFQLTSIPWDSYNVDRIDIQRGPNSILFGFGSPAGIINATRIKATMQNEGEFGIAFDRHGSLRLNADLNRVLIEDELAVRVALLNNETKYRQDPAYQDDSRFFITGRYTPKPMQGDSFSTTISGSFESGEIDANRPRSITPIDRVTPWFRPVRDSSGDFPKEQGLGRAIVPVDLAYARDFPMPGVAAGQRYDRFRTGEDNPDFLPGLNSMPQYFGGTAVQINGATGQIELAFQHDPRNADFLGLGPDGQRDGSIQGHVRLQPVSMRDYMGYADEIGLPFVELGQYKNFHMTDPGIFNFWDDTVEGPNKWETEDWDHSNLSFAQTFADNRFGYELVFDKQNYDSTQERYFNNDRVIIDVDMSATIAEFQVNPNDPTERYTYRENPNAGKPFITGTGQWTNGGNFTTRQSTRLTAFARHDFTAQGDQWWRRLLGKHDLTGLFSKDKNDGINQRWQAFATEDAYGALIGRPSIQDNRRQLNITPYLGGSLINVSNPSEANIPGMKSVIQIPATIQQRFFDATWNAPDVDPGAPYTDYQNGNNLNQSTQSENPANYVGWVTQEVGVLNARAGDRDELTTGYFVSHEEIDSKAFVLQSQFWDGAVIGMYGWREDEDVIYRSDASTFEGDDSRRLDLSSAVITADQEPENSIDIESNTWSLALHANKLFGLDDMLPVDLRFYYSTSENFRPAAGRIDLYGKSFTPPKGSTVDKSVLISSKDNRYSLRVTEYETSQTAGSAANFGNVNYYLGQMMNRGINAADRYEYTIDNGEINGARTDENTYQPRPGQTQAEADAEEAAAVAGYRAFQSALYDLAEDITGDPYAFFTTWGVDPQNYTLGDMQPLREPPGFAITQDAVSQGYEFELIASPLDNWSIAFNAAKTEAVRDNIGGDTLIRHLNLVEDMLENTPAGNLRLSNGDVGASTAWEQYQSTFKGSWELVKLREGTSSDELREWRYNLVTNYRFQDGALKGWNAGLGYRWQDDVVIGYPIRVDSDGVPYFVLDEPYRGPTEANTDLWVGYERQLNDKIHWRAQFNVRNAFADKDLIPINTQPDGTPAGYRLGAATTWTFSNTFSF